MTFHHIMESSVRKTMKRPRSLNSPPTPPSPPKLLDGTKMSRNPPPTPTVENPTRPCTVDLGPKVSTTTISLSETVASQAAEISALHERIKRLEKSCEAISLITQLVDPASAIPKGDLIPASTFLNMLTKEVIEKLRRSKNVIMYNVPDRVPMSTLLPKILYSFGLTPGCASSRRLRKHLFHKPAPILIQFQDNSFADHILRHKSILKNSTDSVLAKIIFKPDLTPNERISGKTPVDVVPPQRDHPAAMSKPPSHSQTTTPATHNDEVIPRHLRSQHLTSNPQLNAPPPGYIKPTGSIELGHHTPIDSDAPNSGPHFHTPISKSKSSDISHYHIPALPEQTPAASLNTSHLATESTNASSVAVSSSDAPNTVHSSELSPQDTSDPKTPPNTADCSVTAQSSAKPLMSIKFSKAPDIKNQLFNKRTNQPRMTPLLPPSQYVSQRGILPTSYHQLNNAIPGYPLPYSSSFPHYDVTRIPQQASPYYSMYPFIRHPMNTHFPIPFPPPSLDSTSSPRFQPINFSRDPPIAYPPSHPSIYAPHPNFPTLASPAHYSI